MESDTQSVRTSKKMLWAGRIISALPALFMFGGAIYGLTNLTAMEKEIGKIGYPGHLIRGIIILEIACVIVYAIPQTSVLGAILLTGYLGGATASHVRIGEPWFFPVIFGVLFWLGLYLRDARVRALFPLRSCFRNPMHNQDLE